MTICDFLFGKTKMSRITFNMSPMEFLSSSWMIIVGFVNLRPATRTRMMRRKL